MTSSAGASSPPKSVSTPSKSFNLTGSLHGAFSDMVSTAKHMEEDIERGTSSTETRRKEFDDVEVKSKHVSKQVTWVDEAHEKSCGFDPLSMRWQATVASCIMLDISFLILDLVLASQDKQSDALDLLSRLITIVVFVVLSIDFVARFVTSTDTSFFRGFDALILTATLVDIIIGFMNTEGLVISPSAARVIRPLRLLRPIEWLRKIVGTVVDTAADITMDEFIQKLLGEVIYLTPERVTLKPSDGLFFVEKTHILNKPFEGVLSPITVKGGFVERLYVDLDINAKNANRGGAANAAPEEKNKKSSCLVVKVDNLLLVLGPSSIRLGDKESWSARSYVEEKTKLVELTAGKTDMLVGSSTKKKKEKEKKKDDEKQAPQSTSMLGKLRQALVDGPLGNIDLSNISLDIQNFEVRFEDFELLPQSMSAGMRIGSTQFRIVTGSGGGKDVEGFRALGHWGSDDKEAPASEVQLASSRPSTETIGSKARSNEKVEKAKPPVKIAVNCHDVLAWCDLDVKRSDQRTYTHFFEGNIAQEFPRISEAAALFKKQHVKERFKFAVLATLRNSAKTNRSFHRFEEKVLPHQYLLMPLNLSFHGLSMAYEAGNEKQGPEQVFDFSVPWLQVHVDRQQIKCMRLLLDYLLEWISMDKKISRLPLRRPFDSILHRSNQQSALLSPAKTQDTTESHGLITKHRSAEEHELIQELKKSAVLGWWVWGVQEIASEIAPNGKLLHFLEIRRLSHYKQLYYRLVLLRNMATAAREKAVDKTQQRILLQHLSDDHLDKWDEEWEEELRQVQASLPLPDIIIARTLARRELLNIITSPDEQVQKIAERRSTSVPGQRSEPLKARICINHVRLELMDPPNESGYRAPLLRGSMDKITMDWTKNAPLSEWNLLNSAPTNVLDHGKSTSPVESLSCGTLSSGPVNEYGEPISGWLGVEGSVASFAVIYCQAPSRGLRNVVVQHSKEKKPQKADNVMFHFRLARWSDKAALESKANPRTGIVTMYLCSLKVVEYHPLIELLAQTVSIEGKKLKEDPFNLRVIRAQLAQRRRARIAHLRLIRYFEMATSQQSSDNAKRDLSAKNGAPTTGVWKLFVSIGDITVTLVMPYTRRLYLINRIFLPRCQNLSDRASWPAQLRSEALMPAENAGGPIPFDGMKPWVPFSKLLDNLLPSEEIEGIDGLFGQPAHEREDIATAGIYKFVEARILPLCSSRAEVTRTSDASDSSNSRTATDDWCCGTKQQKNASKQVDAEDPAMPTIDQENGNFSNFGRSLSAKVPHDQVAASRGGKRPNGPRMWSESLCTSVQFQMVDRGRLDEIADWL